MIKNRFTLAPLCFLLPLIYTIDRIENSTLLHSFIFPTTFFNTTDTRIPPLRRRVSRRSTILFYALFVRYPPAPKQSTSTPRLLDYRFSLHYHRSTPDYNDSTRDAAHSVHCSSPHGQRAGASADEGPSAYRFAPGCWPAQEWYVCLCYMSSRKAVWAP